MTTPDAIPPAAGSGGPHCSVFSVRTVRDRRAARAFPRGSELRFGPVPLGGGTYVSPLGVKRSYGLREGEIRVYEYV